jgi:hypothetical protein
MGCSYKPGAGVVDMPMMQTVMIGRTQFPLPPGLLPPAATVKVVEDKMNGGQLVTVTTGSGRRYKMRISDQMYGYGYEAEAFEVLVKSLQQAFPKGGKEEPVWAEMKAAPDKPLIQKVVKETKVVERVVERVVVREVVRPTMLDEFMQRKSKYTWLERVKVATLKLCRCET